MKVIVSSLCIYSLFHLIQIKSLQMYHFTVRKTNLYDQEKEDEFTCIRLLKYLNLKFFIPLEFS